MAQLFAQVARYDPSRDALTWALTLTTWQCRSARRRRARRGDAPLRDDSAEGSAATGAVIDGAAAAEHRDLVRAALAALEGLAAIDVETIAIAVSDTRPAGAAAATFRKRLERALARLRTSWRSRHGTL